MKELSIFIDESGDFGEYDLRSPYYIISMVFHNQENNIEKELNQLELSLSNLGYRNHLIHAGPIIRNENEYKKISIDIRKKMLMNLASFIRKTDISCESFVVNKKDTESNVDLAGKLSKEIALFIRDNYVRFLEYDIVKIYYDNGQIEVTKILSSVLNALLNNVEFKKVIPSNYRLFQVADLICTIKLTELKLLNKQVSKSELLIFNDERTFKKNYLKVIQKKKFNP